MTLPLLHSPADILRWALVAMGVGANPTSWGLNNALEWPVFNDNEPSNPDNCLTTYDTSPQDDGRSMVSGERYEHCGIQVRVRSTSANVGYVKAKSLMTLLNEQLYGEIVSVPNSAAVYEIWSVSRTQIIRMGKDSPTTKRSLHVLNGLVTVERLS